MSEEELQSEQATEETPTQTEPELNDELVAKYLGVDAEFFAAEIKPQAKGLDKLYAKLNKVSAEMGRQKAEPQQDIYDDDVELDERSKRILDKYIEEKIAPIQSVQRVVMESEFEKVIDTFSESHKDVPADKVDEVMREEGLWAATTPTQLAKNLERAYKLAKTDITDLDAEVERRVAARLSEVKEDGEIVEVKPKRTPMSDAQTEADILNDADIPWYKRMDMFSK